MLLFLLHHSCTDSHAVLCAILSASDVAPGLKSAKIRAVSAPEVVLVGFRRRLHITGVVVDARVLVCTQDMIFSGLGAASEFCSRHSL
ncbi:uncharacterized protein M421DRAFT_374364 [Didymella exigua CBS 183.55]|uniref:Uncharacterized protein n=1 Tax=Didymella exigua CBS 183.55 TaxID=1150837 RepID=A0A6A5RRM5_9PLEO|nr:uncharacterized protein M421DRAFT_374364 [Didymella exigua CBS 183.55]KAF1930432.1 hypothetical protein M421DRAFT_374364 [Didymella exigua CBS 183.55]